MEAGAEAHGQPLPPDTTRALLWRSQFALEWEVSKLLAVTSPQVVTRQLVLGWEFLEDLGVDPVFVWKTTALLRGVATFRYCDRHHANPEDVSRAVRRLLREIEEVAA